jgi:hypothetical protein
MNRLVLVSFVLLLLIIVPVIHADCDEERIRITLTELINTKVKDIKDNTDASFQAYEQFNTKQMADFLNRNEGQLQQTVFIGVIALFGIVLFTSSMWGWIRIRREKITMMHILDEVRTERKFLEEFVRRFNMNPEEIKAEVEKEKREKEPEKQKVPQIEPVNLPEKEKKGLFGRRKTDASVSHKTSPEQIQQMQAQVQAQHNSSPSVTPKMQGYSVPPEHVLNEPVHPAQQFVEKPATDAQMMSDMMKYYQQQEAYQRQMQEYQQQQELIRQSQEQEAQINKLKSDLEAMYKKKNEPEKEIDINIETHEPVKKSAPKPKNPTKKQVKQEPKQDGTEEPAYYTPDYSVSYDA